MGAAELMTTAAQGVGCVDCAEVVLFVPSCLCERNVLLDIILTEAQRHGERAGLTLWISLGAAELMTTVALGVGCVDCAEVVLFVPSCLCERNVLLVIFLTEAQRHGESRIDVVDQ
jgi:hypothetical protein